MMESSAYNAVPNIERNEDLTVSILTELLQLNQDAHKGYHLVAEKTTDKTHAEMYNEYAEQRERFCAQLIEQITSHGGSPDTSGTVSGSLHRAWLNIKTAVTDDNVAILAECVRGDQELIEAYQDAIVRSVLPEKTEELVREQFSEIKAVYEKLSALESVLSNKES